MTRIVPIALVALVLAGCAAPADDAPAADVDPDVSWAARALPTGKSHDHFDLAQHTNLSTPNFDVLGWDPLLVEAKGGASPGGYACGEAATTKDGRRLAVVNSITSDVAFVVVDVTDPARPQKVGEYLLTYGFAYDVALTADGEHVVIAAQRKGPVGVPVLGLAPELVTPRFRDACTGEVRAAGPEQSIPMGPSTIVVGIQDPKNPVLVDIAPSPWYGPHSVSTAQVGADTFVVSSVWNFAHGASYFQIYLLKDTPAGKRLELQSAYQTPIAPNGQPVVVGGHYDATIAQHPVTKQVLAYLADWDGGVAVVDITNPRAPMLLSQFGEWDGKGSYRDGDETGNMHGAVPIEGLWEGRHYVLAGQEIVRKPADHPTGWIYILDDTDPTDLQLVGRWTLPVDVDWEDHQLVFSTHYFALVERTLFVALYHGGLWAVDLGSAEKLADPPTIGVFMPDRASPKPAEAGGHGVEGIPNVMEVLPNPDGTITVFESSSGAYVVRFDATRPSAPPPTWLQQMAAGG